MKFPHVENLGLFLATFKSRNSCRRLSDVEVAGKVKRVGVRIEI